MGKFEKMNRLFEKMNLKRRFEKMIHDFKIILKSENKFCFKKQSFKLRAKKIFTVLFF